MLREAIRKNNKIKHRNFKRENGFSVPLTWDPVYLSVNFSRPKSSVLYIPINTFIIKYNYVEMHIFNHFTYHSVNWNVFDQIKLQ